MEKYALFLANTLPDSSISTKTKLAAEVEHWDFLIKTMLSKISDTVFVEKVISLRRLTYSEWDRLTDYVVLRRHVENADDHELARLYKLHTKTYTPFT